MADADADADYTGLGGASTEERLRTVGTGIGLTIGGFAVAIVVVILGLFVLLPAFGIDVQNRPLLLVPVSTILQGLGFGLAVGGYLKLSGRTDLVKVRLPTLRDLAATVAGVILLLLALAGVSVVFSQFGIETAQNEIEQIGSDNPEVMLYMIPLAFLVIGPGEELLFRGAIQGLFRESYAVFPAIALSSALFAVAHITALAAGSLGAKAATISALFALSLILGASYEYTDNLVVPALVHGAYDAIVFTAIYAQATGGLGV
jgi:membrane protease YdiL (CAAX protease family)